MISHANRTPHWFQRSSRTVEGILSCSDSGASKQSSSAKASGSGKGLKVGPWRCFCALCHFDGGAWRHSSSPCRRGKGHPRCPLPLALEWSRCLKHPGKDSYFGVSRSNTSGYPAASGPGQGILLLLRGRGMCCLGLSSLAKGATLLWHWLLLWRTEPGALPGL